DSRAVDPFSGNKVLVRAHALVPELSIKLQAPSRLYQVPLGEIAHERADAERPSLALFTWPHAVDEPPKFLRTDRHDIARLVRETQARAAATGDGREHRPKQEDEPVRIGMVGADRLRGDVGRIAADLGHR